MATPFTPTQGSSSIGATTFSLPNGSTTLTAQTSAVELEVFIGLGNLIAGDQYRVQVLETTGGVQSVVWESWPTGASRDLWIPPRRLSVGWDVQMKLIAGSARTIAWTLKGDVGDRNALTVAAGAITAIQSGLATAAAVSGVAAAAAAAVWSTVSEVGETAGDAIRNIAARLLGTGTVRDGDGAYVFLSRDGSKTRVAQTRTGTARTTTTRDGT